MPIPIFQLTQKHTPFLNTSTGRESISEKLKRRIIKRKILSLPGPYKCSFQIHSEVKGEWTTGLKKGPFLRNDNTADKSWCVCSILSIVKREVLQKRTWQTPTLTLLRAQWSSGCSCGMWHFGLTQAQKNIEHTPKLSEPLVNRSWKSAKTNHRTVMKESDDRQVITYSQPISEHSILAD